MAFWSDRSRRKAGNYRRSTRRVEPSWRSSRATPQSLRAPWLHRWAFCALVMLAVTALNFLPFEWAASCQTYLAYCFQPGAAEGTRWAAWAGWQPNTQQIVAVWQRLLGEESDTGLAYPCTGQIISTFAWRHHPVTGQVEMHYGIDIQGTEGTPVEAAGAGVVREVAEDPVLGLYLVIDHGEDLATRYGHLQEVAVTAGAQVRKGQVIGKIGKTGLTNDAHLHFEVLANGQPVDPLSFLPR